MQDDVLTGLLPVLGRSVDLGFNVFDVMHHGVHEKQMSNVFRWLLDDRGSHQFGDLFVRIFVAAVNEKAAQIPDGTFLVRQEVNTVLDGDGADIADIVLESDESSIVVENYLTSDGHGHDFERYLTYARTRRAHAVVVLLCRDEDSSLQTLGWQDAVVLTYEQLVARLHETLESDRDYRSHNVEAFAFVDQMYRKFVTRRAPMADDNVLDFIAAMISTGEAIRYQEARHEAAGERLARDVAEQAQIRLRESREVLQRMKDRLKSFSGGPLKDQLNASLGEGAVSKVSASYKGIYQWTVNFEAGDPESEIGRARLQLKFGPSAWFANEQDPDWKMKVDPDVADYSHLFITRAGEKELRQSQVTIKEVLGGLEATDVRLRDEMLDMLGATHSVVARP